jgi:hypothetical protein
VSARDALFDIAAEAALTPIKVRPIAPTAFNNVSIRSFALWFLQNEKALHARYAELGRAVHGHGLEGAASAQCFLNFAKTRWDIERGVFE